MTTPPNRFKHIQCPNCKQSFVMPGAYLGPLEPRGTEDAFDPTEWQSLCERVVLHLSNVLVAASRTAAASAIIQMLREFPHNAKELEKFPGGTVFMKRVDRGSTGGSPVDYNDLVDLVEQVSKMTPARRALLEASVAGVLIGRDMAHPTS